MATTTTKKAAPKKTGLAALLDRKTDAGDQFYKFFNLKKVSDLTRIQPDKIYNNMRGDYNSLSSSDTSSIAKILIPNVKKFFERLGYEVTFKSKA
jgi:hypothetical protein